MLSRALGDCNHFHNTHWHKADYTLLLFTRHQKYLFSNCMLEGDGFCGLTPSCSRVNPRVCARVTKPSDTYCSLANCPCPWISYLWLYPLSALSLISVSNRVLSNLRERIQRLQRGRFRQIAECWLAERVCPVSRVSNAQTILHNYLCSNAQTL